MSCTENPSYCKPPQVTRAWRKLGDGAIWLCACGKIFRLRHHYNYAGDYWEWSERGVKP